MSLVDVDKPQATDDDVVVAVRAAGICGSDLELFGGTRPGAFARYPIIPGHEWSGVVVEAGRGAAVASGDRVVAEGFRYCGICDRCREGTTNLCMAGYAETGFTHPGAFADLVSVPSRLVHVLPPNVDFEAAALLEPAACVAEGLMKIDIRPGLEVGVVGSGTLGLLAAGLLSLTMPARLVLVGSKGNRLRLGRELGATETVDFRTVDSVRNLESNLDLVFEATNRAGGAQLALELTRRGGTVVVEGINGSTQPSVVSDLVTVKQIHVRGVFGASSDAWRWVIDRFKDSGLHLERLVSHRFPLERAAEAFATVTDPSAVKVQLIPK
jgi:threonine dehydrogenase-like Zn-dependent dehydrogenase